MQQEFPLDERPFFIVAEKCGIEEEEVLNRVQDLKRQGIIRRIGAIFDGARLGRASALCAARVSEEKIAEFVRIVNAKKNVTHNYRRDHEYNIWFTISADDRREIESFLAELKEQTGVADILEMKAVKTFKINASFEM